MMPSSQLLPPRRARVGRRRAAADRCGRAAAGGGRPRPRRRGRGRGGASPRAPAARARARAAPARAALGATTSQPTMRARAARRGGRRRAAGYAARVARAHARAPPRDARAAARGRSLVRRDPARARREPRRARARGRRPEPPKARARRAEVGSNEDVVRLCGHLESLALFGCTPPGTPRARSPAVRRQLTRRLALNVVAAVIDGEPAAADGAPDGLRRRPTAARARARARLAASRGTSRGRARSLPTTPSSRAASAPRAPRGCRRPTAVAAPRDADGADGGAADERCYECVMPPRRVGVGRSDRARAARARAASVRARARAPVHELDDAAAPASSPPPRDLAADGARATRPLARAGWLALSGLYAGWWTRAARAAPSCAARPRRSLRLRADRGGRDARVSPAAPLSAALLRLDRPCLEILAPVDSRGPTTARAPPRPQPRA